MFLWTCCMKKVYCCCFGMRRTQLHKSTQEKMFLWGASHACLSKPLRRLDMSLSCLRILELLHNGAITKHRKNFEWSPGQSLTVSHLPSMSWFQILNMSGGVNCVTKSLKFKDLRMLSKYKWNPWNTYPQKQVNIFRQPGKFFWKCG